MEVRLTPDQEAFIRQAIETGRFHRAEDAVEEEKSAENEPVGNFDAAASPVNLRVGRRRDEELRLGCVVSP